MEGEGTGSSSFHGYGTTKPIHPASSSSEANKQTTVVPAVDSSDTSILETAECSVREQDRFMPIANVIRIMRRTLPPHAKISDDAKETIQECVSEFISFITGEANERCQREQRKTITAEDVLWAMSKLGFDDYIHPLTLFLNRYRDFEGDRGSIRGSDPSFLFKRPPLLIDPSHGHHAHALASLPATTSFGPVFHLTHSSHHHHHHPLPHPHPHPHPHPAGTTSFFGINASGGYLKDSSGQPQTNVGSSQTTLDPYGAHHRLNNN